VEIQSRLDRRPSGSPKGLWTIYGVSGKVDRRRARSAVNDEIPLNRERRSVARGKSKSGEFFTPDRGAGRGGCVARQRQACEKTAERSPAGLSVDHSLRSAGRQVNQDYVRVLSDAIEYDLLAVWSNIKTLHGGGVGKVC